MLHERARTVTVWGSPKGSDSRPSTPNEPDNDLLKRMAPAERVAQMSSGFAFGLLLPTESSRAAVERQLEQRIAEYPRMPRLVTQGTAGSSSSVLYSYGSQV